MSARAKAKQKAKKAFKKFSVRIIPKREHDTTFIHPSTDPLEAKKIQQREMAKNIESAPEKAIIRHVKNDPLKAALRNSNTVTTPFSRWQDVIFNQQADGLSDEVRDLAHKLSRRLNRLWRSGGIHKPASTQQSDGETAQESSDSTPSHEDVTEKGYGDSGEAAKLAQETLLNERITGQLAGIHVSNSWDTVTNPRPDVETVGENIGRTEFGTGPADVTSYHDFQSVQIAFPPIWTEALDPFLQTIGEQLYERIAAGSGFKMDMPDEEIDLEKLEVLLEQAEYFTTTENIVPDPVQAILSLLPSEWRSLTAEDKAQIEEWGLDFQSLDSWSPSTPNELKIKLGQLKDGSWVSYSLYVVLTHPDRSTWEDFQTWEDFRVGHKVWIKISDPASYSDNVKLLPEERQISGFHSGGVPHPTTKTICDYFWDSDYTLIKIGDAHFVREDLFRSTKQNQIKKDAQRLYQQALDLLRIQGEDGTREFIQFRDNMIFVELSS